MRVALEAKIAARQRALSAQGLLRQRQTLFTAHSLDASPRFLFEGQSYLNFSCNDYLGLSRHPALIGALHTAAQQYGVGGGASPLVTGYSEAHFALEQKLCELTGHQAALLFSSGFSANTALMKTLFDKQDIVIADKLVHASIIDGLRDSGAELKRFLHNSPDSAERLLSRYSASALVTESVFSMDGDSAPIAALSALCRQHQAWLIVDDAHGFGVLEGFDQGNAAERIDVQVVTFGKALGCQGAAVLGSKALIDFLVSNAREYIYSTALSPATAALVLAAIEHCRTHPEQRLKLLENIKLFKQLCHAAQIPLLDSDTAIQPLIIGDSLQTISIADALKSAGIWVGAIRPPTVPVGSARLRITLSASHSAGDITYCVSALAQVLHDANLLRVSEYELKTRAADVRAEHIAERFSAAATSYQDHNKLQRLSAASLLNGFSAKGNLLDIGAGPGTRFQRQHTEADSPKVFALDIALGMLQKLQHAYPDYQSICADAEQLPFSDNTMDCIYSNLALQWCVDFATAVAEMARVLKPKGECHITVVADGSLTQLAALGLRVNAFVPMEKLRSAFDLEQWQLFELELVPITVHFNTLKGLLYSIKGVGASVQSHHVSASQPNEILRLRGRKDWLALVSRAETLRQAQGLPLTYQIVQIRARRLG